MGDEEPQHRWMVLAIFFGHGNPMNALAQNVEAQGDSLHFSALVRPWNRRYGQHFATHDP
jgi:hypothetical protein